VADFNVVWDPGYYQPFGGQLEEEERGCKERSDECKGDIRELDM